MEVIAGIALNKAPAIIYPKESAQIAAKGRARAARDRAMWLDHALA
jgi:hypothetical protein